MSVCRVTRVCGVIRVRRVVRATRGDEACQK